MNTKYPLFLCLWLFASSLTSADSYTAKQMADCNNNSASEWSSSLNRCVGKVKDIEIRHEAQDCNSISDMAQRETCHKALAEKDSGLSSDPKKLKQGNTTGSMMMNAAYTIVSVINFTGSGSTASSCTSKTIFGVTAVAGLASDFYLKYSARKKIKELSGKYKLDVKNEASDAQVKALEYLKEEQKTVADIAGLEKKRNMLLMMGYSAAGIMAAVELAFPQMNPDCNRSDEKTEGDKKEVAQNESSKLDEANKNIDNTNLEAPMNKAISPKFDFKATP